MEQKECVCGYFNDPKGHAGDRPKGADWWCEIHGMQHLCYAGTIGDDARVVPCRHTSQNSGDWEERFDADFEFDGVTYKGARHWKDDVKKNIVKNFIRTEIDRAERRVKDELREKVNKIPMIDLEGKAAGIYVLKSDVLNLL